MEIIAQRTNKLEGETRIPASKSHSIRAAVIGSLASGESKIMNPLNSDDVLSGVSGCKALGAKFSLGENWVVQGFDGKPRKPSASINIGNSGTSLRLLTSVSSLLDDWIELDGDESTRTRPMKPLLDALEKLGVQTKSQNGKCPVFVKGPLYGGQTQVEGISSQFVSSLLISCPLVKEDTVIDVNNLKELPYIEMTLDWLERTGIKVKQKGLTHYEIPGGQSYNSFERSIPADFSSATFPLCAAAMCESDVLLTGLDMQDKQGDKEVVNMLKSMGAKVNLEENAVRISGETLVGKEIDMSNTPDALPAMSIVGCIAQGETRLVNVQQARLKETDRIKAMASELKKMGADIEELPDGLVIRKSELKGAAVHGHNDHRIIMALALAGLNASGKTIVDTAEWISITFPNFVEVMQSLGANMEAIKSSQ